MDEKTVSATADQLADVEVGEILRRTRLHYGQSLKDVENILRIRQSQIDAIEKGDVTSLPGRVYTIGFVRSYAEYLGLDGAKVVHLYKTQYMDRQPREVLSFPVPASETKTPPLWLMGVCVLALLLLMLGWAFWPISKSPVDPQAIKPIPPEITERITENVSPEPSPPPVPVAEPAGEDMGVAQAAKPGLILNIQDNSWVEIKDASGAVIVSNVLKKGDQYFVPDSPGLTMSLGNAGGVEIVLDGRALMPLGKVGDVLRDIPLDTGHLKTLEFKAETAAQPAVVGPPENTVTPQN